MYRYSICEPLNPEIIEKGKISARTALEVFKSFPWSKYLEEMEQADEREIQYSPSLEIENITEKCGITFSAVGSPDDFEFYIFYKRAQKRKLLFGLISFLDKNYINDIRDQSIENAEEYLDVLLRNDFEFLNEKFK